MVDFIDYGTSGQCDVDELRLLPVMLARLPAQAWLCRLTAVRVPTARLHDAQHLLAIEDRCLQLTSEPFGERPYTDTDKLQLYVMNIGDDERRGRRVMDVSILRTLNGQEMFLEDVLIAEGLVEPVDGMVVSEAGLVVDENSASLPIVHKSVAPPPVAHESVTPQPVVSKSVTPPPDKSAYTYRSNPSDELRPRMIAPTPPIATESMRVFGGSSPEPFTVEHYPLRAVRVGYANANAVVCSR
jgi:hypothetical protein